MKRLFLIRKIINMVKGSVDEFSGVYVLKSHNVTSEVKSQDTKGTGLFTCEKCGNAAWNTKLKCDGTEEGNEERAVKTLATKAVKFRKRSAAFLLFRCVYAHRYYFVKVKLELQLSPIEQSFR